MIHSSSLTTNKSKAEVVFLKLDTVESTMSYVSDYFSVSEDSVLVVTARQQTKGMGRRGRTWASPPGGLYMTIIKTPVMEPRYYQAAAAVAVVDAISELTGYRPRIKWTNDIYTRDLSKKLGGILLKLQSKGADKRIAVGIGLNVSNNPPAHVPNAESLKNITERVPDANTLAEYIVAKIIKMESWDTGDIISSYRKRSMPTGTEILIEDTSERAVVEFITEEMGLEVRIKGTSESRILLDESIRIIGLPR